MSKPESAPESPETASSVSRLKSFLIAGQVSRLAPSKRASDRLPTGPPVPSRELGHVTWAKAWVTWFLEWRAQREAGSTEQRLPPAPGSGRITGRFEMN
ncbi:hypothetical protein I3843_02G118800 [Carya illinoinensis]|nr:hypothetical protein I3843_02G118800 [Carya illinoinensis]